MDVIALGKGNKTLKEIKDMQENVVGSQAELHFPTVDHRLDWIDAQTEKVLYEQTRTLDLSLGVFEGTEFAVDLIRLKKINNSSYVQEGTWTSPIIDLGASWHETKLIDIVKQINTGSTDCSIDISYSEDEVSFTSYESFDEDSLPQARFLKIKATLTAGGGDPETNTFDYSQEEPHTYTLNEYVKTDGSLKLKTEYTYPMETGEEMAEGDLYRKTIHPSDWKLINTLKVN